MQAVLDLGKSLGLFPQRKAWIVDHFLLRITCRSCAAWSDVCALAQESQVRASEQRAAEAAQFYHLRGAPLPVQQAADAHGPSAADAGERSPGDAPQRRPVRKLAKRPLEYKVSPHAPCQYC